MEPWKLIVLIVPAGLLLGTLGGHATRPVPLMKEERPWPASVHEKASAISFWRPIHEDRTLDPIATRYSYRPNLDYGAFAWPDQRDFSARILAEDYSYRSSLEARYAPLPEPEMPLTRRAEAELATQPPPVDDSAGAVETASTPSAGGEIAVLPPVPPVVDLSDFEAAEAPDELP
jgi:hypothetical protein